MEQVPISTILEGEAFCARNPLARPMYLVVTHILDLFVNGPLWIDKSGEIECDDIDAIFSISSPEYPPAEDMARDILQMELANPPINSDCDIAHAASVLIRGIRKGVFKVKGKAIRLANLDGVIDCFTSTLRTAQSMYGNMLGNVRYVASVLAFAQFCDLGVEFVRRTLSSALDIGLMGCDAVLLPSLDPHTIEIRPRITANLSVEKCSDNMRTLPTSVSMIVILASICSRDACRKASCLTVGVHDGCPCDIIHLLKICGINNVLKLDPKFTEPRDCLLCVYDECETYCDGYSTDRRGLVIQFLENPT